MFSQRNGGYTRLLLPIVMAVIFYGFPVSAEIYRWVDDQGRIHYGDHPAAGAETVDIDVPPRPEIIDESVSDVSSKRPQSTETPSASALASCLRNKGVKYYTASWCPQCAKQHKLFGESGRALPAVECSVDGGREQTQACNRAGIKAYPTWVFADGSRSSGVKSLTALAQLSGCSSR